MMCLKRSLSRYRVALTIAIWTAVVSCSPMTVKADSILELLSGFDTQRLAGVFPIRDTKSAGEMSRLLYRLRKADVNAISERADENASRPDDVSIGEGTVVDGRVQSVKRYKVPAELIEFLGLESFYEIQLKSAEEDDAKTRVLFLPPLAGAVSMADRLSADAVYLGSIDQTPYYAAGRAAWMPSETDNPGWQLLTELGVDLSGVIEMASRNRQSLGAADADAFYSMLVAADRLRLADLNFETPVPQRIKPLDLLQSASEYHGQWVRIDASTVRITRVSVSDPARKKQLGQDHYFQVDASGDLGKTVIQLARSEGIDGDPIRFSGSYPISMVTISLPDFLQKQLDDQDAVVAMISHPVSIDGFFFRLWSYQNEFMTREGGGKQVGPLVIVSQWRSVEADGADPAGIEFIGYALAMGIFLAIAATVWWSRRNAKLDAEIRDRSRQVTTIEL